MTIMHKAVYGTPRPIAVECEVPSYPHCDADGKTIFVNTHFLSEAEAWDRVVSEHDAGLSMEARRVKNLRAELAEAEKQLADAAILATDAREAFRQWEYAAEIARQSSANTENSNG